MGPTTQRRKPPYPPPFFKIRGCSLFPRLTPAKFAGWSDSGGIPTSKLCNVLCADELDRRVKAMGLSRPDAPIDVFAFDPGLMPGTGLARDYGPVLRFLWFSVLPPILPALRLVIGNIHTPAESGAALARLVLDPALAGQGGRYFEGTREIRSSAESYDETKAETLWAGSERLIGVAESSPTESVTPNPQG